MTRPHKHAVPSGSVRSKEPAVSIDKRLPEWVSQFLPIVITAALTWVGSYYATQQGQAVQNAVTTARLDRLQETVEELRKTISDGMLYRYTSQDASRDRATLADLISAQGTRNNQQDDRIDKNTDAIRDLQRAVARLEERVKIPAKESQ